MLTYVVIWKSRLR